MCKKAIGCDVAPRKGADIFDGKKFVPLTPAKLVSYAKQLSAESNVVLAWDAPLTGPSNPDELNEESRPQDFTQRPIETFFRNDWGYKVPTGISVLPYSGCPHWTLTQHVLGLPRIGPYSRPLSELPFRPAFTQSNLSKNTDERPVVVEVHPALAIWLWCRDAKWPHDDWKYKRNPSRVASIWSLLKERLVGTDSLPPPVNDDQLDSLVSWILADRWINGNGVVLLGNAGTGSFLIPEEKALAQSFDRFLETNP